jgi:hypothetical protein
MDTDGRLLNPALVSARARDTPFVGFREPNTETIHLRTIGVAAIPPEDHEGEYQRASAEPARHVAHVQMRHDQRG